MKQKDTVFLKGDFWIAAVILLLAGSILFLIFFPRSEKKYCIIKQNNVIINKIELKEDLSKEIAISGEYENILEICNGRVRIKYSDCPNQQCVSSGWISRSGQAVVCLPNRVVIEITSDSGQEVDAIVR